MKHSRYSNKQTRHRRQKWPIVAGLLLILFIAFSIYSVQRYNKQHIEIVIFGTDISDLSKEDATASLLAQTTNVIIQYDNKTFSIEEYMEPEITSLISKAYADKEKLENEKKNLSYFQKLLQGLTGKKTNSVIYDFTSIDSEALAHTIAGDLETELNISVKNSTIEGFDTESGSFQYASSQEGMEIDVKKLATDLKTAFDFKNGQTKIDVSASTIPPEITEEDYKLIGTYTTTTTANADRNTNVRLACEAINGKILEPGEQFWFNDVVGERTPEKGYKEAAAYASSEVVQEYGGGVCQVSSTLYNAVIAAGLQTDERTGHTFKPTYVTPGQDATVSYKEPDFAFTNNSTAQIGIKATYWDQTVCIEVYGIPLLEEGVIRYLKSEQKSELDPPAPIYTEDPSLDYGKEVTVKAAEPGSEWITYLITEKNGEIIDQFLLHNTRYQGHPAEIKRNTTVKDKEDSDKKEKKKDKKDSSKKDTKEKNEKKNETPAESSDTNLPDNDVPSDSPDVESDQADTSEE